MKTTLNLRDDLLLRAKRKALDEGTTLTRIVEEALARCFDEPERGGEPFRFVPLSKKGVLVPGVDVEDRDALYEKMEERS